MNSNSGDTRYTEWWRWPLVPIASLLGAYVGAMALWVVQWLIMKIQGGFSEDGWYFLYILPVIMWGVAGWLYAWIACTVAPRGKIIAGSAMTTLQMLLALAAVKAAWKFSEFTSAEAMQLTAKAIAMAVASIAAIMYVRESIRRASNKASG